MEEDKRIVFAKYEFQYQDKSKLMAFFPVLVLSGFPWRENKTDYFAFV